MARGKKFGYAKCSNDSCKNIAIVMIPGSNSPVCNKHYQRHIAGGNWNDSDRKTYTICVVDGCDRAVRSAHSPKCETHYYRDRRNSPKKDLPINTDCVICGGALSKAGTKVCGLKECLSAYAKSKRDDLEKRLKLHGAEHKSRAVQYGVAAEDVSIRSVCERDAWTCQICQKPVIMFLRYPDPGAPSIDHKIPLAAGGGHTYENCRLTHLTCNLTKATAEDSKLIKKVRHSTKSQSQHILKMFEKTCDEKIAQMVESRGKKSEIRALKRARSKEKRALKKLARRTDLQKLLIRGSDLLVIGDTDDGRTSETEGPSAQRSEKTRPKTRWGKRPFGNGKRFAFGSKDRQADHGSNENNNAPDQD